MTISTRAASEIRAGIIVAREKIKGARRGPDNIHDASLFARAYHHEITAAVNDGRIRPPRGGSGMGKA